MAVTQTADALFRRGGTNNYGVTTLLNLDSSYTTGGYLLKATDFALSQFQSILCESVGGYTFQVNISTDRATARLIVNQGSGGTTGSTTAVNATSAVTGTAAAQTFSGLGANSAVNIAGPFKTGTGQSSAGQVITTTDNQTMTLNQCAGMWFVSATHGPYLIESNTAVTGAPAVLTIVGTAPTTDAGTYQILTGVTPAGTNSTSAVTATAAAQIQTAHTHSVSAAAETEVPNGTNLSTVTNIQTTIEGL